MPNEQYTPQEKCAFAELEETYYLQFAFHSSSPLPNLFRWMAKFGSGDKFYNQIEFMVELICILAESSSLFAREFIVPLSTDATDEYHILIPRN